MGLFNKFQSYQFRQINPDTAKAVLHKLNEIVSIVSIQADQSRRLNQNQRIKRQLSFQSYQFRQINPDRRSSLWSFPLQAVFQSYQFMQINPDNMKFHSNISLESCFNRINSCRSIPTPSDKPQLATRTAVSIVSIHADQSRHRDNPTIISGGALVSIVSIHADQSRRDKWGKNLRKFRRVSIVSIHADQSRQ